jgi:hypothetical protein
VKKIAIFLIALLVISVGFLSGCTEEDSDQISINSFEVTPSAIEIGETSILSWDIEGATTVTIDNGIGDVALTGTRIISPTVTTTYTLTATKSGTTKTATTQIIVASEPSQVPTVGMVQVQNYISIQEIEQGPITLANCNVIVVNISGVAILWATHQGTIQDIDGDTYLSSGDTITFSTTWLTGTHTGDIPYTVSIVYHGDTIGSCKFTPI